MKHVYCWQLLPSGAGDWNKCRSSRNPAQLSKTRTGCHVKLRRVEMDPCISCNARSYRVHGTKRGEAEPWIRPISTFEGIY